MRVYLVTWIWSGVEERDAGVYGAFASRARAEEEIAAITEKQREAVRRYQADPEPKYDGANVFGPRWDAHAEAYRAWRERGGKRPWAHLKDIDDRIVEGADYRVEELEVVE